MARMKDNMDPKQVIIHASNVNQRTATYGESDLMFMQPACRLSTLRLRVPS